MMAALISIHMPHTWHDDSAVLLGILFIPISIHMPHTWHDTEVPVMLTLVKIISIHMPHTWHDLYIACNAAARRLFQSTCHIRGMTVDVVRQLNTTRGFQSTCHIRGMTFLRPSCYASCLFQSTCHIRGMTLRKLDPGTKFCISIHMPHTWHDPVRRADRRGRGNFNPHATYVA